MDNQAKYPAEFEALQNNSVQNTFCSSWLEGLCALLTFIPAYLYVNDFYEPWKLAAIAAMLIVITELLNINSKAGAESYVWLACFAMCTVSCVFRLGETWSEPQVFLFIHIFFVWWVLSRSGKTLEGKSGHMLPADAFNAFVIFPFSHFFLRIRCLVYNIRQLFRKNRDGKRVHNLWLIPAALLCLLLFGRALGLLMQADERFGGIIRGFSGLFSFRLDEYQLFCIIFSLPVGAWLFGLMAGSARIPRERLDRQRAGITAFLYRIRKIPAGFWIGTIGLFTLLYLGFFILQGSYLFGAFTHTLPDGFIVSQYAREGFFELCRVMAVNFTVLWVVTRMASFEAQKSPAFSAVCLALLLESMLFAVIAFSKLWLYISCFGFTPKRLQSAWLVCVLFAGCLLWSRTILTGKPVFRKWMYFGAVSLSILTLF